MVMALAVASCFTRKKRIISAAPMSIFTIQEITMMALIWSIAKDKLIIHWQCFIALGN